MSVWPCWNKRLIKPTSGPVMVERFGKALREKPTTGEVPFRNACLGSIVDRNEVDDGEFRILGRKDVLEQAVLANGGPHARGSQSCSQMAHPTGVPPSNSINGLEDGGSLHPSAASWAFLGHSLPPSRATVSAGQRASSGTSHSTLPR